MKTQRLLFQTWLACSVGLAGSFAPPTQAQYTGNNQTNIISGVASNWNGDYYVGSNYVFDALLIENGGALTNIDGYIGSNPGANSNAVVVSGSGSVWDCVGPLYDGGDGSGNSLVIRGAGKVLVSNHASGATVGQVGSNNWALVADPGSAWNIHGPLTVGYGTSGNNTMVISNGGMVVDDVGQISLGTRGNHVLVTGMGSVWSNRIRLAVGGVGSTLVISNGGQVFANPQHVEVLQSEIGGAPGGATSNSVLVTGAGSVLNINANFLIPQGFDNTGNALTVANGGSAVVSNLYVGRDSGADNNRIDVLGGYLFSTNAGATSVLEIRRGKLTLDQGTVTADKLILTNGSASVIAFNAGLLNTKGTAVTNSQQFVVGNGVASANFHLLGGVHSFNNGLRIRSNSFLTGCGTITGTVVVDAGGSVAMDCGLTFTGVVTNNGLIQISNGSTLEGYATFVNNGTINIVNGFTNFHAAFINNGTIQTGSTPVVSLIAIAGADIVVQIQSVFSATYQLQVSPSLTPTNWVDVGSTQAGNGSVLTFTDTGGVTNSQRYYRVKITGL
ncbi:MAG TPA: hypothetical protein VLZ12_06630 [Verrucomicrobiae bacterium]|nr:hypothetical protein [Verrucomicrobiae bacterium]